MSGNPGGFWKKLRGVQGRVIEKWGPHVDDVMQRLLQLTADPDGRVAVSACKVFLEHTSPAPRPPAKAKNKTELPPDVNVDELMRSVLSRPEARAAALKVLEGGKK